MNLKEYFDLELSSSLIHAVVGFVAGYLSFILNQPVISLVLMIIFLGITAFAVKTLLKINKDRKWWISNGAVIFIFTWFVVWTLFYNLQLYSTLP